MNCEGCKHWQPSKLDATEAPCKLRMILTSWQLYCLKWEEREDVKRSNETTEVNDA